MKLTIKEIAKMAGVSPSAVSIALNGRIGISDETRQRILRIVGQTNYVPNQNSRSLVMKKTQAVALLYNANTQPLGNFFQSQLIRYLLEYCSSKRYSMTFTSCEFGETKIAQLPTFLRSGSVDGMIAYGYIPLSTISSIVELGLPFLMLDSHQTLEQSETEAPVFTVRVDYHAAATIAMNHLIEQGHRKIAYVGSNFPIEYSQQTFDAYQEVMQKHNLSVPINWIQMQVKDTDHVDSSVKQIQAILSGQELPTAVFCASDVFAIGVLKGLKAHGLRVPEDISLIGIDDIVMAEYTDPALSTIHIDMSKLCTMGCDLLFRSINGEKIDNEVLMYDAFSIVQRESIKTL